MNGAPRPGFTRNGTCKLRMDDASRVSDSCLAIERGRGSSFQGCAAIILADTDGSALKIASLTVLERLVVSLSRAGMSRIFVVSEKPLRLARAAAMGLSVEYAEHVPDIAGEVLVASGNVLATAADLKHVIASHGRLMGRDGEPLPLGVVDGFSDGWEARLEHGPGIRAVELAAVVTRDSAGPVERAFWNSLTSSSDGWVDRHFNRPVGRLLSKKLTGTSVSPNQVSTAATLVGVASAWLFAAGTAGTAVAGAVVLQLSAILDCIDGDLARALYKQSSLGKWLDIVGDQVVHMAVFVGIGVGLWRAGATAPVMLLGTVAAAGVVLSFLVVLRTLLKPGLRGDSRLQKLIDATTNRDFSVLLFLFALFGVLDWFLWLAAVGSHVFWLVALALQIQENRRAHAHAENS